MDFIKQNYLNTSSMITINNNTATAENLFNRNKLYQYYTDGLDDDTQTLSITVTFDSTSPVSRIALIDTNFKEFKIFYNGSTASTLTLTNADTSTCSYTGNADQYKYFRFSTVQCSSITIDAKTTQTANQEKVLGLLVLSDLNFELELKPSAKSYKPKKVPKQIVHKLSDGGTRLHNVSSKWETDFTLDYLNTTQRNALFEIYDSGLPFNFCPFGTATGWDGFLYETVWDGPFEFYQYSDNAAASGFSGKVSLNETPY